jgi:hypothetical protein
LSVKFVFADLSSKNGKIVFLIAELVGTGSTRKSKNTQQSPSSKLPQSAELRRERRERLERDFGIFGDDSQQRAGGWIR